MNAAETVSFDILLKPPATAADANTVSIDTTRPAPEDVERCRRWLIGRGVEAHDSGFGLACTANRQLFEEIFSVTIIVGPDGKPELSGMPRIPAEIEANVEQLTLTVAPELF